MLRYRNDPRVRDVGIKAGLPEISRIISKSHFAVSKSGFNII